MIFLFNSVTMRKKIMFLNCSKLPMNKHNKTRNWWKNNLHYTKITHQLCTYHFPYWQIGEFDAIWPQWWFRSAGTRVSNTHICVGELDHCYTVQRAMTLHVTSWVSGGLTASARCRPNSRVAGDLGHIGAHVTSFLCKPINLGLLNILSLYSCGRTHSLNQASN